MITNDLGIQSLIIVRRELTGVQQVLSLRNYSGNKVLMFTQGNLHSSKTSFFFLNLTDNKSNLDIYFTV